MPCFARLHVLDTPGLARMRAANHGAIVTFAHHGYEKFFPLGLDAPSGTPDFTAASADPASIRRSSGLNQVSLPLSFVPCFISAPEQCAVKNDGPCTEGVTVRSWTFNDSSSEFNDAARLVSTVQKSLFPKRGTPWFCPGGSRTPRSRSSGSPIQRAKVVWSAKSSSVSG